MNTISTNQVKSSSKLATAYLAKIGMLSAVAAVLMFFEVPVWFAPGFYKLDFSEVPVLIGGFALGPIAGVLIELIKILIKFILKGTFTAGVGELGNFLIGCSLVVPAAIIYKKYITKKSAIIGLSIGVLCMIALGCVINAYLLLPVYAKAMHMPIDALVAFGTKVNPSITGITSFVMLAVAPLNLLKGTLVSIITVILYKRLSPVIKKGCD